MFNKDMIKAHVEDKKKKQVLKSLLQAVGMEDKDIENGDTKTFEDFITNFKNTRLAKIKGTDYSFYYLPPPLVNEFINGQIEKAAGKDVAMSVTPEEFSKYQYARLRSSLNPNKVYNHDKDSG